MWIKLTEIQSQLILSFEEAGGGTIRLIHRGGSWGTKDWSNLSKVTAHKWKSWSSIINALTSKHTSKYFSENSVSHEWQKVIINSLVNHGIKCLIELQSLGMGFQTWLDSDASVRARSISCPPCGSLLRLASTRLEGQPWCRKSRRERACFLPSLAVLPGALMINLACVTCLKTDYGQDFKAATDNSQPCPNFKDWTRLLQERLDDPSKEGY